jgi:hypothetical protein
MAKRSQINHRKPEKQKDRDRQTEVMRQRDTETEIWQIYEREKQRDRESDKDTNGEKDRGTNILKRQMKVLNLLKCCSYLVAGSPTKLMMPLQKMHCNKFGIFKISFWFPLVFRSGFDGASGKEGVIVK